jgi:hypothetical protein
MKRLEDDRASISVRDMGNNRTGGSLSTERALHNVRHSSDLDSDISRFVDHVLIRDCWIL